VVMTGSALLIATPVYGWYAGLLLALIVMSGALEWLPVALAPTLIYLSQGEFGLHPGMARLVYAVAGVFTMVAHLLRRRSDAPPGGCRQLRFDSPAAHAKVFMSAFGRSSAGPETE
jgi:hypothetical protein